MTTEDTAEPTLAITEQAMEKVRGFLSNSDDPENQAMWVAVSGVSGGEYLYDISLNALDGARQSDVVQVHGDLTIVVPESSVAKLRGATIDWSETPEQSGLALVNPNKPPVPAELPMMSPSMAPPASPPIDSAMMSFCETTRGGYQIWRNSMQPLSAKQNATTGRIANLLNRLRRSTAHAPIAQKQIGTNRRMLATQSARLEIPSSRNGID